MAGWQDDPVVGGGAAAGGGGWQSDPIVGGAKAAPAQSGMGPIASTALAGLDYLGMGLGTKNPFMAMPQQLGQDVSQAHQNLGMMDYPLAVAGYALGPGKLLGPAGATASLAGRPILQGMAEGALAGGASNLIQGDNPLTGAAGGAALGGAGGAIGKGIAKAFSKPGTVDPAAAIAATKQTESDAYSALRQAPVDPQHVDQAIGNVMGNLDPSVETGMSGGLTRQINDIRNTLMQQNTVNADQVNSWRRQINDAAARERYPTDSIVAAKINDNLSSLIPSDLDKAASQASQQRIMAENLAEWQRKAAAGAPLGQAPLTEAERFYQGTPKYQPLVDLYNKSQSQNDPSWALGHMAAGAIGDIGGYMLGFPGHFAGEALGYLGVKPAIKGAFKGAKQNAVGKAIQQLYPQYTGVPLTGGQQVSPGVGDAIKTLMLGTAY